jgi:hypothetical protein
MAISLLAIENPEAMWQFIEHELSDLFTTQGVPILPGELLRHTGLITYCKSLSRNWNFVNGFDLLAGTVAIYGGGRLMSQAIAEEVTVDSFADFARQFGICGLELALALTSCNPFLLLGAALQLAGSFKALMNEGTVVLFRRLQNRLTVEFVLGELSVDKELDAMGVDVALASESVDASLESMSVDRELERD